MSTKPVITFAQSQAGEKGQVLHYHITALPFASWLDHSTWRA